MRHVGKGLNGLLDAHVLDLVQSQSENDGDGESKEQGLDADTQGVAHQTGEQTAGQELFKVLQANPTNVVAENEVLLADLVVLERDGNTGHGHEAHEEQVQHRQQQQSVQLAALTDSGQTVALLFLGLFGCAKCLFQNSQLLWEM